MCEHIIRNGMWDVFSLPDPHNKEKKLYILLNNSIFHLYYLKLHVQSLHEGSKEDQYAVQKLTWSGVYLSSTLSNTLLQKVLTLVPLIATGPEFFVATMTTFPSDSHEYFGRYSYSHEESQIQILSRGERYRFMCITIGRL